MSAKYIYFVVVVLSTCTACPEGFFRQCFQCPTDFVMLHKGCYYFSVDIGSWIDGVKFCSKVNSHLVAIDSIEESVALNLHIALKHGKDQVGYWTSGSDIHTDREFLWMSGGNDFSYTNWCESEPNNASGGFENCIHIYSANGHVCWNDLHCSKAKVKIDKESPIHFLCEYQPMLLIE